MLNNSPLFLFSDNVYNWLENALDYGISEYDFWNMTLAELERALDSKRRIQKAEAQERATYDYILADLIGRSMGRIYSSSANYPNISEVYPTLFDTEIIDKAQANRQDELSAIRFKQFAAAFNSNYTKEAEDN